MQKGVQKIMDQGATSLNVKGNFSWGFAGKDDITVDDCLTLKDMDFKINKGEFVCVIGAVGCGKSSLLNAIAGNMMYLPEASIKARGEKTMKEEELTKYARDLSEIKIDDAPVKVCGKVAYAE
jgi:ABC-type cobalamin/Fe3+-siderophores transport system ATPase subunit